VNWLTIAALLIAWTIGSIPFAMLIGRMLAEAEHRDREWSMIAVTHDDDHRPAGVPLATAPVFRSALTA